MNTQHTTIDNRGKGEEVEHLAAGFPYATVAVFLLTFFVEAVDLGDLSALVVSTDEGDSFREFCLEAHEESECLEREVTTVYEVTEENIVCGWRGTGEPAADAEEFEEVVELAMDVAADGDRGGNGLDVGFCSGGR